MGKEGEREREREQDRLRKENDCEKSLLIHSLNQRTAIKWEFPSVKRAEDKMKKCVQKKNSIVGKRLVSGSVNNYTIV